jgi:hypothetical protein
MEDVQNANPTILNASDLPSRRRETQVKIRKDGGSGLFDSLQPTLSDPYSLFAPQYQAVGGTSESETDEDDSEEEIDEQEIYG